MVDVPIFSKVAEVAHLIRTAMRDRLVMCPVGDTSCNCPLYEIRKLSSDDRLEWLGAKTDEEVAALFKGHTDCLSQKREIDALFQDMG